MGGFAVPMVTVNMWYHVGSAREKTGRTGSMVFVVIRYTLSNQRGEMLAIVDNRFMHR